MRLELTHDIETDFHVASQEGGHNGFPSLEGHMRKLRAGERLNDLDTRLIARDPPTREAAYRQALGIVRALAAAAGGLRNRCLCLISGDCPDFRVSENGTVPFEPRIGLTQKRLQARFRENDHAAYACH